MEKLILLAAELQSRHLPPVCYHLLDTIQPFPSETQPVNLAFVPDDPKSAKLKVMIRADSIEVTGDISSKDRKEIEKTMREDVLEIDRFPEITFESTSIEGEKIFENQYRVQIQGNFTLHGETRLETIEAQVTVNGDQVRAYGDFPLRQTNYDIKLVSVAGGTLKLKDELRVSFDITVQPQ